MKKKNTSEISDSAWVTGISAAWFLSEYKYPCTGLNKIKLIKPITEGEKRTF